MERDGAPAWLGILAQLMITLLFLPLGMKAEREVMIFRVAVGLTPPLEGRDPQSLLMQQRVPLCTGLHKRWEGGGKGKAQLSAGLGSTANVYLGVQSLQNIYLTSCQSNSGHA